MTRAATALLAGLLLAIGIAACGGGDSETADVVPKSTPDLVAPRDTSLPEVASNASTTSTNSVTTPTTPATSSGTGAATSGTGAATGGTGGTGGAGTGGTSTGTGGGTSTSGGFGGFCTQNPGAC